MSIDFFSGRLALLLLILAGPAAGTELPAWIIEVPASLRTLLVADTGNATLYEYAIDKNGGISVEDYYMSIGEHGAGKTRSGDRRTPLGNYLIVDQLDTARLDPKYGVTAFPIDYPNIVDSMAGRTGSGLWLHGVPEGAERRPERDTDGCIALANDDLADLATRLVSGKTPLVVARKIIYAQEDEKQAIRSTLEAHIEQWRNALATRDAITYLSLYAEDFRYRGLERGEWASFRAAQLAVPVATEVTLDDVLILADPEDEDLVMTRFRATVTRDAQSATWTKRLYWRRAGEGRFQIIAENND